MITIVAADETNYLSFCKRNKVFLTPFPWKLILPMTKNLHTETRRRRFKFVLLIALGIFLLSSLVLAMYIRSQLSNIAPVNIIQTPKALGISPFVAAREDSLIDPPVNIALFGLDKRPHDKYGNSDAIMIISISKATDKIKLSSIMRDTYVKVDTFGMDKINAAYRIGGPQLALKTLNENFNLHLENFVSVDFNGMAQVIDALDGITINVKKEEVGWVNAYLDENNKDSKVKPPYVTKAGTQTLNGKQAVAYTRIRYVGNDYERTQRQRTVLSLILKKLKDAGISEYPKVVSKILPYVETSIPRFQLLTLGSSVFINNIRTIEERRFPQHFESNGKIINGIWYLVTDLKSTSKSLFDFMYEGTRRK